MQRLRWGLALVLLAALLWWSLRGTDPHSFLAALAGADPRLLGLAALLNLVVFTLLAGWRLQVVLEPLPHPQPLSFRHLLSLTLAQSAAHNLLPAPGGQAFRALYLVRHDGFDLADMVAAQIFEKLLEGLAIAVEVAILTAVLPMSSELRHSLGLVGGAAAALTLAALVLARISARLAAFRGVRLWGLGLASSLLADLTNALMVVLVLGSLGASLPLSACFVVCLAMRLTGLVPSTPGQWGVQEAGAVAALRLFHIEAQTAMAFALLYRAAYWIPTTAAGLFELRRLR